MRSYLFHFFELLREKKERVAVLVFCVLAARLATSVLFCCSVVPAVLSWFSSASDYRLQ